MFAVCLLPVIDQRDQTSDVNKMVCCFLPIATFIFCLFFVPELSERLKAYHITMSGAEVFTACR